jgi:hypothetical protein
MRRRNFYYFTGGSGLHRALFFVMKKKFAINTRCRTNDFTKCLFDDFPFFRSDSWYSRAKKTGVGAKEVVSQSR